MMASGAETASYQDFSARLQGKMQAQRVPASATIEITRRCPLECRHCYNNLSMSNVDAMRGELTYGEHRRILDELAEAGCLWILYTGGEIFARKDFLEIYTYAKKKGFLITLFTNGTLITQQVADYLREWRPFSIEITLYGSSRETYERLTGIAGSYERCLRGIRLLLERRLPLKLKTVAVSINKHEIREMKKLADELGVSFKFDAMMNPRIDCSQSPLAVRLQPWEIVKMDLEDEQRVSEWKKFATKYNHPVSEAPIRDDHLYQCGGGVNSFALDPEGKMSICVLSHFETYDLRHGNLREGWEEFLRQVRSKKIVRVTKCSSCGIKPMCGMCPANGELENGDPESPVDFLCHVAHLRATALNLPIPPHGDCEYCKDGPAHAALTESINFLKKHGKEGWMAPDEGHPVLPILNQDRLTRRTCSSCDR